MGWPNPTKSAQMDLGFFFFLLSGIPSFGNPPAPNSAVSIYFDRGRTHHIPNRGQGTIKPGQSENSIILVTWLAQAWTHDLSWPITVFSGPFVKAFGKGVFFFSGFLLIRNKSLTGNEGKQKLPELRDGEGPDIIIWNVVPETLQWANRLLFYLSQLELYLWHLQIQISYWLIKLPFLSLPGLGNYLFKTVYL